MTDWHFARCYAALILLLWAVLAVVTGKPIEAFVGLLAVAAIGMSGAGVTAWVDQNF